MALCNSSCNAAVPRFPTGCTFTKRKGGVPNLIFISCNWKWATSGTTPVTTPTGQIINVGLMSDYTTWSLGVQKNMIRISPEGLGDKPASTFTNARFSSCRPEEIASETHSINFQSFDIDANNFYDRTYWNTIRTNYNKYRLLYWDCNGLVYYTGDVTDPGFEFVPTELGYQIPQTNDENSFYQANLSWKYEGIPAIIDVANLDDALTIDVNT